MKVQPRVAGVATCAVLATSILVTPTAWAAGANLTGDSASPASSIFGTMRARYADTQPGPTMVFGDATVQPLTTSRFDVEPKADVSVDYTVSIPLQQVKEEKKATFVVENEKGRLTNYDVEFLIDTKDRKHLPATCTPASQKMPEGSTVEVTCTLPDNAYWLSAYHNPASAWGNERYGAWQIASQAQPEPGQPVFPAEPVVTIDGKRATGTIENNIWTATVSVTRTAPTDHDMTETHTPVVNVNGTALANVPSFTVATSAKAPVAPTVNALCDIDSKFQQSVSVKSSQAVLSGTATVIHQTKDRWQYKGITGETQKSVIEGEEASFELVANAERVANPQADLYVTYLTIKHAGIESTNWTASLNNDAEGSCSPDPLYLPKVDGKGAPGEANLACVSKKKPDYVLLDSKDDPQIQATLTLGAVADQSKVQACAVKAPMLEVDDQPVAGTVDGDTWSAKLPTQILKPTVKVPATQTLQILFEQSMQEPVTIRALAVAKPSGGKNEVATPLSGRPMKKAESTLALTGASIVGLLGVAVLVGLAGVGALISRRRKDEDSVTVDRS